MPWSVSLSETPKKKVAEQAREVFEREVIPQPGDVEQFDAVMGALETVLAHDSFGGSVVNLAAHGHVRQDDEDISDTYVSVSMAAVRQ